jgi:hypothetical protein
MVILIIVVQIQEVQQALGDATFNSVAWMVRLVSFGG